MNAKLDRAAVKAQLEKWRDDYVSREGQYYVGYEFGDDSESFESLVDFVFEMVKGRE